MQLVKGLSKLRDRAKRAIKRTQERMKEAYSIKQTKHVFNVGDQVIMW